MKVLGSELDARLVTTDTMTFVYGIRNKPGVINEKLITTYCLLFSSCCDDDGEPIYCTPISLIGAFMVNKTLSDKYLLRQFRVSG